jgi:hypothetical protein
VKAEDVKLQGAGISPKQCKKCAAEKGQPTELTRKESEEQTREKTWCALLVTQGHHRIDARSPARGKVAGH